MRPGASYTWISSTHFETTYGNMRGHFTMTNLLTGDFIISRITLSGKYVNKCAS